MSDTNTIMLGSLIDMLIDAEKQEQYRQKQLRFDTIVTGIEMSDFPQAWKDERMNDLRLAMQYGVRPEFSGTHVEQDVENPKQAYLSTFRNHL